MQRLTLPGLILFTIVTNLIPLYGVYAWGWAVRDVVLLYWVETVIVGVTYVIRIWTKVDTDFPWPATWGRRVPWLLLNAIGRGFNSAPFVLHYGGFCFVLGMALLSYFFFDTEKFSHDVYRLMYERGLADGLYLAVFGVLVSHFLILATSWFANGAYVREKGTDGILRTYARIIILMFVLIVPANMANGQDEAFIAILTLVGLKTVVDLLFLAYDSWKWLLIS